MSAEDPLVDVCQWCARTLEPRGHWTRRPSPVCDFVSVCRRCEKAAQTKARYEEWVTEGATPWVIRERLIEDGWPAEDAFKMTDRTDVGLERLRQDPLLRDLAEFSERLAEQADRRHAATDADEDD